MSEPTTFSREPLRKVRAVLLAVSSVAVSLVACAATTSGGVSDPPSNEENVPARSGGWAPGRAGLEARRAAGQAEVGEAARTLETAGDACGTACPALDAFRLGVKHLCAIDETRDDVKRCRDIRAQLVAATARLKAGCGTCNLHPDDDAGDVLP